MALLMQPLPEGRSVDMSSDIGVRVTGPSQMMGMLHPSILVLISGVWD